MPNAPTCLHFATLTEENISFSFMWNKVSGATGYELEVSFGESFEDALKGLCWDSWDCEENAWQETPQNQLTWNQWEALQSKGRCWADLERSNLMWSVIDEKGLTWKEFQHLPISFLVYRGREEGLRPGPDAPGIGLGWNALDSRFLTWQSIEAQAKNWDQRDSNPADSENLAWMSVTLLGYGRWVWLRLRAYNQQGEYSPWLETGRQPVRKYRDTTIYGDTNGCGPLQMIAEDINTLENEEFSVVYSQDSMKLEKRPAGGYRTNSQLKTIAATNGSVRFTCNSKIPPGHSWSGLLAQYPFEKIKNNGCLVQADIVKNPH